MLRKTHVVPAPEQPSAPEAGRPAPDDLLRRLRWTVIRPLAAKLGGDERSLLRSFGLELAELREYQPGDDVRYIDWNTTARSDRPFVRESYVERALDALLLLDLSTSVDWGTAQCLKRGRLLEFAAIAGQLPGWQGNRIGVLAFADRPLGFIPPARGRQHLQHLLEAIRAEPGQAGRGPTDLAAAARQISAVLRRRSLVLVVSDFLAPAGWQAPLRELAQRHEVVAVRLHDPREAELPDIGLVTLEDPETGAQLLVDCGDPALRERFRQAAQAQFERIRADLAASGIDQVVLSTGEDLMPALLRFLRARRARAMESRS